jgi:hypothetical protein
MDIEIGFPQHGQDNIFNFTNPDDLVCVVWTYQASNAFVIQVTDMTQRFQFPMKSQYISFALVGYFSGVMGWQGVNFCSAASNLYIDFINTHFRKFEVYSGISDHDMLLHFNLYRIKTSKGDLIEFLAGKNPTISE